MSGGPRVFLDTTIQIERLTGTRARRAQLTAQLASKEVVTSTYVLGEFLRTLVKDCITLYTLVSQNVHLDDVEVQIANRFNKREASRCLLLWATLYGTCRFCGRGACKEHAQTMPHIEEMYRDDQGMHKALVVADALWCGVCQPREDPVYDILCLVAKMCLS